MLRVPHSNDVAPGKFELQYEMIRTFQRALTQDELATLRRKRPPFFARKTRRLVNEEILRDLGFHKRHSSSSLVPRSTIFAECEVFRLSDFSEELKKRIGV